MKVLLRSRDGFHQACGDLPSIPTHGSLITIGPGNLVNTILGNPGRWVGHQFTVHYAGAEYYACESDTLAKEMVVLELETVVVEHALA
jgi:hypothetical protein